MTTLNIPLLVGLLLGTSPAMFATPYGGTITQVITGSDDPLYHPGQTFVGSYQYNSPTIAALEEKELKYAVFPDSSQHVLVFLDGEHGNFNVSCIHNQDDGLIIFHSTYPINARELARADTVHLLNHLNNSIPGPAFRLDPEHGEIVFRHCLHLEAYGSLDPQILINALALCLPSPSAKAPTLRSSHRVPIPPPTTERFYAAVTGGPATTEHRQHARPCLPEHRDPQFKPAALFLRAEIRPKSGE